MLGAIAADVTEAPDLPRPRTTPRSRLPSASLIRVTSAARVFVARLAGAGVFDPQADQVGKLRDIVVLLRTEQRPPRVLGLVVEVVGRRRIFVPMTRVTTIDAGQVVVRGAVNLRRFEQRPGEALVMGDLLDRRVDVLDTAVALAGTGGKTKTTDDQATVMDVAIEHESTGDWVITQVAVRLKGGLRRRSHTRVLDYDQVSGLTLPTSEQGAENLLAALDDLRAADLAHALQDLSSKRRVEVARTLDDERLADVLEELPEDDQIEILQMLEAERAADVLEEMDPDDAADLISELPPEQAADLLERMEPEEAADIRRLLIYDDYTAGGMAIPTCRHRWPDRFTWCALPWTPPPGAIWVPVISSDCCGNRPQRWYPQSWMPHSNPFDPMSPSERWLATSPPTTSSRYPWSMIPGACSVR